MLQTMTQSLQIVQLNGNLLDFLGKESETAIKWFKQNEMIVNLDKFQVMVLGKKKKKETIN